MLLAAETLHTGTTSGPGWLRLDGSRVADAGLGSAPGTPDLEAAVITPGFVDVHCHGGGGAAFDEASDHAVSTALAAHRSRGTTTTVASLVTASIDDLIERVTVLAGWVEAGELAGIHLEGPWLASGKKGAHDGSLLRAPRPTEVAAALTAGRGTIRQVTLAPELPGAADSIGQFRQAGVVVSIGHTMASYADTVAAVEAGASGATHLFNAMPALEHRSPGPVLALLDDHRVTCELILDGVHVDPALAAWVLRINPGRVALITDAMAAAGCTDGAYRIGGLEVTVDSGVARLVSNGAIAGSTLFLAEAVARAAALGVPADAAVAAATSVPARFLGLDAGVLAPGAVADLVVTDSQLRVERICRHGEWIASA